MEQQQPVVAIRVPPQPLPTMWELTVDPTQGIVVLTANTSAGISFFFMDAEGAAKFADQVASAAKQASSGLLVPSSGLIL